MNHQDKATSLSTKWLKKMIAISHTYGLRMTPVYEDGKTKPYKRNQSYADINDYKNAVYVGWVLDDLVLLDYDGNKANGDIISQEDLATTLGLKSMPAPIQINTDGDSVHWLFKLPESFNRDDHTQANNGGWLSHIDVKTGNQLIHIKPGKTLYDGLLDDGFDEAPTVLLDALYRDRSNDRAVLPTWNGTQGEVEEARELLTFISADCSYDDWLKVLMAIHSKFAASDAALELADEWSSYGYDYMGTSEISDKLASFTQDGGVTYRTLCHMAKENGADLSLTAKMFDDDGTKRKSFDELRAMVSSFDKTTTPAQVEDVIASFPLLNDFEQDVITAQISKSTNIKRASISKRLKASEEGSHDHLQLARRLVDDIGRDNVISLKSLTYKWSARGVWEVWEDRGLKQYAQAQIEAYGENVTAQLINSVAAVFNNELYAEGHRFNVGPADVVNCMNGEFNVMECSGQAFGQHIREHYRTTQIPIEYDPDAKAPRFEQFLDEIFDGDDDSQQKKESLLQMMGYSLMSHCKYEKFVMLLGSGANGKSVLLAVLEALCGVKNTAAVQPNEVGNKFQRANLNEKLVNIVTEIKQGAQIEDAALKAIVSGEVCTVEHKGKDPFEMRPFSTCWFGTNHMPHTRDFSDALFRRALILTFNNCFSPELGNCNHNLKDELIEELPGILNMVTERYAWVELIGFTIPKSSLAAAKAWRIEADQVAQFVEECCVLDSGNEIRIGDLYRDFNQWADDAGVKSRVTKKSFSQRLSTMGYGAHRSSQDRLIKGLKMRDGAMAEIENERLDLRSY